jgi:basic membrane protein A and related proteins
MVKSTAFGAGATEPARRAVAAAVEELKVGKPIFVGPLKDNKGNVVVERTLGLYDGILWQTNYLLDGIVGSVT